MKTFKNTLIAFCAVILAGCTNLPTMSDRASKIQIHKQSSVLLAGCKKLGPADATISALQMAEIVYDAAIAKARDNAAALGGDSMVIFDVEHTISGLTNAVTVHATALQCY